MARRAALGLFVAILLLGLLAGSERTARAAITVTWTGGVGGLWSNPGNWSPAVPVAGDTIVFPAAAANKTNTNDLAANTSFAQIVFDGSGYAISGNAIVLAGNVVNDPGSGTNSMSLAIGGPAAITQLSGRLVLAGNNTFAGAVNIGGGFLGVTSDTGLGNSSGATFVSSPGALQLSNGVDLGLEAIFLQGQGPDTLGALQSLSGTNFVSIAWIDGAVTIGVGNSTLVIETLNQSAPGASLTLVGGGKLQVENAAYAGPLDVEAGNLTWNATSQAFVEVDRPGWLRGLGTVASVNVIGGLVWPGSGNAPGLLTVLGPTTFSSGTFRVDLDGPVAGVSYGQLATAGLTLAPIVTALEVDLTFLPTVGQVFTIVQNGAGAVQGTFHDLPEGATFHANGLVFQISYKGGDGNDVTLKVLRQVTADLELTLSGQPSPVAHGDLLVYTIVVSNEGPDTATGVHPNMGTPVGTTFESASGPSNWTCFKPSTSASVTCNGPTLASGHSATFLFTFRVNASASGSVTGTASVTSATNDPNSANNADTETTPIGPGGGLPFKLRLPGIAADSAGPADQS